MTFSVNNEVPITSWELGSKRHLEGKIMMQVTYSDGGKWQDFLMEKDWVISCIVRSQFVRRFPEKNLFYNLFACMYAIKFPSGVIFDCVMAQSNNKDIRRACWR